MFEKNNSISPFIAIRDQAKNEVERKGIETLFSMMLFLKKQMVLRDKLLHKTPQNKN